MIGVTRSDFGLDPFQRAAIAHLDAGHSVVVAAPTGAGKTVVAEHAIELALESGTKAFYTTPIKALSNQKYHDFVRRWGPARVGLLTGDTSINGDADVVVMTTEVLRNMLYGGSPSLQSLGYVILDEVHYLQDPYRGPVWEEVIVHTPETVRMVCLSATVSNADELTAWIAMVRGPTELVVEHTRPVELTNLFMVADRDSARAHLIPTLVDGDANPEGHRFTRPDRPQRHGRQRDVRRFSTPRRLEVLERLVERQLLPAIVFVFSRAGCDEAAQRLVADGVDLVDLEERNQIIAIADRHVAHLTASELDVLRYDTFVRGLQRGVAAHHAGMVPAFKEAVEACFVEGLVKLVFATETLALGINMPARAVVIERLTKYNGDSHQFLTPLEYTQLTGRAGRRGIDEQGFAIVLWSPFVTFEQVADLASSRAFWLRSVFRPTYNMAVNLVRMHDRAGAHRLLDRSFGQFQADRDIARLDDRRRRLERDLAELGRRLADEGVDPDAPLPDSPDAGGEVVDREATGAAVRTALAALRPGDVVAISDRIGSRPAVVLSVAYRGGGNVKIQVVDRQQRRLALDVDDFDEAPSVLATVPLPVPFAPNDRAFIDAAVAGLSKARFSARRAVSAPGDALAVPAGRQSRAVRLHADKRRQLAAVEQRIRGRSDRLARQFDEVVGVLQSLGYVAGWELTANGDILRGIFHECDLAVAEAIRRGILDDLTAPEMAAVVACFSYEHRGSEPSAAPRLRSRRLREAMAALDVVIDDLQALEARAGVRLTRALDPGFMATAAAWAGGEDLADVLDDEEITGGDFVRQIRQLVDLLRQVGTVAPSAATRTTAHAAATALNRGVILASAVETTESDADSPG